MGRNFIRVVLVAIILAVIGGGLVAAGVVPWPWQAGFSGGARELTEAERSQLTTAVESSLQSAQRARFIWYPLREKADGVYCALVNTSNVVGDHTEDQLFEVSFVPSPDAGLRSITSVHMPSTDPSWTRIIRNNCARAGYVAAVAGGGPVTK